MSHLSPSSTIEEKVANEQEAQSLAEAVALLPTAKVVAASTASVQFNILATKPMPNSSSEKDQGHLPMLSSCHVCVGIPLEEADPACF